MLPRALVSSTRSARCLQAQSSHTIVIILLDSFVFPFYAALSFRGGCLCVRTGWSRCISSLAGWSMDPTQNKRPRLLEGLPDAAARSRMYAWLHAELERKSESICAEVWSIWDDYRLVAVSEMLQIVHQGPLPEGSFREVLIEFYQRIGYSFEGRDPPTSPKFYMHKEHTDQDLKVMSAVSRCTQCSRPQFAYKFPHNLLVDRDSLSHLHRK